MLSNIRLIDTRYRENASTTSPTNCNIFIERVENASHFIIDNVSLFGNQYSVDARNNKIYFDDGSARTGTITSGRYTGSELATELQNTCNNISAGYTVTYDSNTNKITFANAASFSLTLSNQTNAIWCYIGFNDTTDTSSSTSHTSVDQVNTSSKYYYLTLDIADNPDLNTNLTNNEQIALIIINSQSWGSLISIPSASVRIRTSRRSFSNIRIKLYDDKGNVVDNGNTNFSFRIIFS